MAFIRFIIIFIFWFKDISKKFDLKNTDLNNIKYGF